MGFPKISLDPLSPHFVLYKPVQQGKYKLSEIFELELGKNLIITRKRDGWKLLAVKAKNRWKLYTDGIRNITNYLPHLVKDLNKLKVPNGSMLAGEVLLDENGDDNFEKVAKILLLKDIKEALKRQHDIGHLKLMPFEVVFWNDKCTLDMPYYERLRIIHEICSNACLFIIPVPIINYSFEEAQKLVKKFKWEGLVLYSKEFTASFRNDGKDPERPKKCFKWKPIFEDDFIVRTWIPHDDNSNKLKEIVLSQIDPITKNEVEFGKHGTFDLATREKLKDILTDKSNGQVAVVQMEFENRYPSGKLRNKRFMRIREDKKPENCIAPQSYMLHPQD